jgi:hypothetical protein
MKSLCNEIPRAGCRQLAWNDAGARRLPPSYFRLDLGDVFTHVGNALSNGQC